MAEAETQAGTKAKQKKTTEEKGVGAPTISADDLAKEFKEHSVAEFFKKNKQMLGLYGKVRTLTTVVHEYVTNAIDACEEAGILPVVEVKIDELGNEYYEVTVRDNGPGLTQQTVGKALGKLLAGTKFHRLIQSRGQQGIGCAACTMLSQTTTGKETKVISGPAKHKPFSLEISIDPKLNEPKLANFKELAREFKGLAIQAKFKGVLYRESEQGVLEYLRRTAIANPHCEIKFRDPFGKTTIFKRTQNAIPRAPEAVKPHPNGVTVDEIISMSKSTDAKKTISFLKNDFDRMGNKAIEEIKKRTTFDLNKDPRQISWEESEEIVNAFKEIDFIAPKVEALRPIGEDQIKKSIQSIVEPEFLTVVTRRPQVYAGGFPFQVEIAIAYGGKAGKRINEENRLEIMRFANRVPLLFDAGNCAITKAVHSIDWKRYDIRDIDTAPLSVLVNFISVHIPYTGAGKQAIADEEEVIEELRLALMDSGRRAGRFISGKRREQEMQKKREIFYKYIPEISGALSSVAKVPDKSLRKCLEKMVLEKLKIDEAKMAEINNAQNAGKGANNTDANGNNAETGTDSAEKKEGAKVTVKKKAKGGK